MGFLTPGRGRGTGSFNIAFLLLRLIPRPRGRIIPWSEMGIIRKTLVVVGGFIMTAEVLGYLLGRLFDVLFFSAVGVVVIAWGLRRLYYRKWR